MTSVRQAIGFPSLFLAITFVASAQQPAVAHAALLAGLQEDT